MIDCQHELQLPDRPEVVEFVLASCLKCRRPWFVPVEDPDGVEVLETTHAQLHVETVPA